MALGGFESEVTGRVNPLINIEAASDHSRAAWNGEMRNLSIRSGDSAYQLSDFSISSDKVSDQAIPSYERAGVAPYAGANRFYPPAVQSENNYYRQRLGTAESVVAHMGLMLNSVET